MKGRPWVRGLGLTLALLGSGLASPATEFFERGFSLLQQHYEGPSDADRPALHVQYAAELARACADQPACPLETGRTVLGELLTDLHDPHTSVRDPETAVRLREALNDGSVLRTGLRLKDSVEGKAGELLITFVAPDSPAARAGLRPFERVTAVNGQALTATQFASAERRGVALKLVIASSMTSRRTVSLTPVRLRVNDLPSLALSGPDATITIPTFLASGTAREFVRLLGQARASGARRLVVDLRYDGGGNLNECLAAASAFTPVGYRLVSQEGSYAVRAEGGRLVRRAAVTPPAPLWTGPVAVLVGEGTASCAEVFTWALADQAVTVGAATKGALNSAVDFYDLPGGNLLSVSSGRAQDGGGHLLPTRIVPQVAVEEAPTPQRDAALESARMALDVAGNTP